MTIKLTTHDLQNIVLVLIHHKIWEKDDTVTTPQDCERLIDIFGDLNMLCNEDNGYTITLDVKEE